MKYIVVVGEDAVGVPFGRVPDNTEYANERTYASTFFGATTTRPEHVGARLPADGRPERRRQLSGSGLRPRARGRPTGRDPAQIRRQITRYITRNGRSPRRGPVDRLRLPHGRRHLRSTSRLHGRPRTNNAKTLISETWDEQLLAQLFPAGGGGPKLNSLNAHSTTTGSLPAAENAAHRQSNLVTTADITGRSMNGRLASRSAATPGSPSRTSIFGAALSSDWAQAYAQGGAGWIGNTGYGLGDTTDVALLGAAARAVLRPLDGR